MLVIGAQKTCTAACQAGAQPAQQPWQRRNLNADKAVTGKTLGKIQYQIAQAAADIDETDRSITWQQIGNRKLHRRTGRIKRYLRTKSRPIDRKSTRLNSSH